MSRYVSAPSYASPIDDDISDLDSVYQPRPGPRPNLVIPGGILPGLAVMVMAVMAAAEVEVEVRDPGKATAAVTALAHSKTVPASTWTRPC